MSKGSIQMCERPGCVAGAIKDGLCGIHKRGAGKPCEWCKGNGFLAHVDERMRRVETACDRCGGVGLVDQKRQAQGTKQAPTPVDDRGLIKIARDLGDEHVA